MTTVLVVEDDADIRSNIVRLLRLEGYETITAGNGLDGLKQARARRPAMVITDIGMPGLDGFALLEAIRADAALAGTAVMLLTALDDRASMRRGMTLGADDYLPKPFTRIELLDALAGLQKKRLRFAPPPGSPETEQTLAATVVFAHVRTFNALAEKLDSREIAEVLSEYLRRASAPALALGGRCLKFVGDGVMAVFAEDAPVPGARRAVAAALAVALATHDFRGWLAQRFAGRGLPPLAVGIGLHAGEVTICPLGGTQESLPIGETVTTAARLEAASKELGWTVVASSAVLQQAGAGILTGGMTSLQVRGREQWVDVAEIVGLEATAQDRALFPALGTRAATIQQAVRENSEFTVQAGQGARTRLSTLKQHRFEAGAPALWLRQYRLLRRIGAGALAEVYLAERAPDGLPVVLKVLEAGGRTTGEHLARFTQEYALLSRIRHPRVTRIHDQGFTDEVAYIAMEYFERGDLRGELRAGMRRDRVLQVLAQLAEALEVIHGQGVIHRDLKPENIMLRPDGSVALADFGVAKSMLQHDGDPLTQTRHGDVVGTPFYLSPEQASGLLVTPATDLYSLGVMLYEMLTGKRPYQGDSLDSLLARHLTAPVPELPPEHQDLQPVLERLMAKQASGRYASARELLADLGRRMLLPSAAAGE